MESNSCYRGDLNNIIRTSGGGGAASSEEWQFSASNAVNVCTSESGRDDFGNPFTHFGDPLLDEAETPAVSGFFRSKPDLDMSRNTVGFVSGGGNYNNIKNMMGQRINVEEEMKRPNYFSRMLQISPASPKLPAAACESPPAALHRQNLIISRNFPVESPAGLQIPSRPNTGVRRRKSQVKKVVCIPAPTPANSRPSGEIVPSDLWAWRKYGQKPIKGSPYPRGYYRCSSSKGCSARKQVERSRADPNMLVITYTSEHNHPWPAQRNSLAGSTRSQPSKTNGPKTPTNSQAPQKPTEGKEEHKETTVSENTASSASAADNTNSQSVKEEMDQDPNPDPLEMDDPEFDNGSFSNSYKPDFWGPNRAEDRFYADLGEIEADSMDIFQFSGGDGSGHKGLDPFSFYDWNVSNEDANRDS